MSLIKILVIVCILFSCFHFIIKSDKVCCMRSGRPPTKPPPCHRYKDYKSCKNSGGCVWKDSKCIVYYAPTTYTMVPKNQCKTFPGHNGGQKVDLSYCNSK